MTSAEVNLWLLLTLKFFQRRCQVVTAYISTVNPAVYCTFQSTDASEMHSYQPNTNPLQPKQRLALPTLSFGSDSAATSFYPGCFLFCPIICLWVELKIVNQILPLSYQVSSCKRTWREWEKWQNIMHYWLLLSIRWNLEGLIDFLIDICHAYLNFSCKNNG